MNSERTQTPEAPGVPVSSGGASGAEPDAISYLPSQWGPARKIEIPAPILDWHEEFIRIRRDIHKHPELGFKEQRTARVVADRLREWGIQTTEGVGCTGVVGTIRKGDSSRAIGLRADLDALPMAEANDFEYRSVNDNVFHGCGHDGHTTMLLAAARYLQCEAEFDGTVQLIFQPAEEGGGGGQVMIEDGLFERFPVDAVFGLHNGPGIPLGAFAMAPGPFMASSDHFDLTVCGRGGHGAMPHLALDPVPIVAQIVLAWQQILSRGLDTMKPAVISVTQIEGGDADNVIPDRASARGTVRTLDPEAQDMIEQRMKSIAHGIAAGFGASVELNYWRDYPVLINAQAETEFCERVARALVGEQRVARPDCPLMGSEDFAFMLQHKPGCYVLLGNGDGESACTVHNPGYDFNDEAIPLGATYWTRLVEAALPMTDAPDA